MATVCENTVIFYFLCFSVLYGQGRRLSTRDVAHAGKPVLDDQLAKVPTDSCGVYSYRCHSGQCIPNDKLCDGHQDCRDGSDEIRAHCYDNSCSDFSFRCGYGACIDYDKKCDGVKDCADGSDEDNAQCSSPNLSTTCGPTQFVCGSGECISTTDLCDGKVDCSDRSDETWDQCQREVCAEYLFRCVYGACIDGDAVCNDINDCADGSDEDPRHCSIVATQRPVLTRTNNNETHNTDGCLLPPYPDNGAYTVGTSDARQFRPGQRIPPNIALVISCRPGHQVRPAFNAILFCTGNNTLNAPVPRCIVECQKLQSTSVNIKYFKNQTERNENDPILPGIRATISCKHSYKPPLNDPHYRDLVCLETGQWSKPLFGCTAECGIEGGPVRPLVVNGSVTNSTYFPWNVAIYRTEANSSYLHICGGTIVLPRMIISAAHCFYDSEHGIKQAQFHVAAGKNYKNWFASHDSDPHQQLRNVSRENILIPTEYRGSDSSYQSDIALIILNEDQVLEMNDNVRPACLDFNSQYERYAFQKGSTGKVAGFGAISEDATPTKELRTLEIPFIPTHPDCYNSVPDYFRPYLLPDKICAGYTNGSSVCEGDSGSGLVFKSPENNISYVRGIVSIDPSTKGLACHSFSYTAFTKISFYLPWIRQVYANLL